MSGQEIGAASFGLVVGLSKFRKQLSEGEDIADRSGQKMGEKLGAGVEKGMAAGMGRAGQSMQNFGSSAMFAGGRLTMMMAPLAAIGGVAVKSAMDFDTSMTRIQTLVGLSASEVDGLRDSVHEMARATARSSGELADAMFFATSAGMSGAEALQVVEAAAKASAVGLGDTAVITDLATSAMNAYGPSVLSATEATDALLGAVRYGKLEPAELAGAMGAVLPVASAMGVGFDEVGAAFAAMSRTGTNASEAATQLRGILTTILSPTASARDALADVGLSVEGLQSKLANDGLLSTLELMVGSLGDNVTASEAVFGNVRALSGVMDMLGTNVADTRLVFDQMADTTGMVDEAFAQVEDTAGFKMKQALESTRSTFMELGATALPIAAGIAGAVAFLADRFAALPDPVKNVIVGVAGVAIVAGPAVFMLGKVVYLAGGALKLISLLAGAIKGVGLASVIANPWVIGVVAALAGVYLIVKHWDTIKEWLGKFFDWFKNTAGRVVGWLTENWQTVAAVLAGPIGIAVLVITKHWDTIKSGAAAVVKWITGRFDSLVSFVRGLPGRIASAAKGAWDGLLEAFKDMLRGIVNFWNNLGFTLPSFTVPSWVPGVGGNTIGGNTISTPDINLPGLAVGGRIDRTGAVIAHRGEIVVPAAEVTKPFDHVSHALGGASAMRPIHIALELDGHVLSQVVVDKMADRERITGRPAFGRSGGRRI